MTLAYVNRTSNPGIRVKIMVMLVLIKNSINIKILNILSQEPRAFSSPSTIQRSTDPAHHYRQGCTKKLLCLN